MGRNVRLSKVSARGGTFAFFWPGKATEDHVRAALKILDDKGSEARKPGMKRKR